MARLLGFLFVLLSTVVSLTAVLSLIPLDWPLGARLAIGIAAALVAPTIVAMWLFSMLSRREVDRGKTRWAVLVTMILLQGGMITAALLLFERRPNDMFTAAVAIFMEPSAEQLATLERERRVDPEQALVDGETVPPAAETTGTPGAEPPVAGAGGGDGGAPPIPGLVEVAPATEIPAAGDTQPRSTALGLESYHLWSKRLGNRGHDSAVDLAVTPKGGVVILTRGSAEPQPEMPPPPEGTQVGVYYLDAGGSQRWDKSITATQITATDLATDSAGNVFLLGNVAGTVDFGRGAVELTSPQAYLVKYAANGAYGWLQLIEVPNGSAQQVAVAPGGELVVAGTCGESVRVGGRQLEATGPGNLFVAKLSPSGQPIWLKQFGESRKQVWPGAIGFFRDETVVIGQYVGGGEPGKSALQPLGPDQDERGVFALWVSQLGQPTAMHRLQHGYDQGLGFAATVDKAGNVIFARGFWGEVKGDAYAHRSEDALDLFIGKFDHDGRRLWSARYGGVHDQAFPSLAIDKRGRVFVAGTAALGIDLGLGQLSATGTSDIFVGIFSPVGKPIGSALFANNHRGGIGGVAIDKDGKLLLSGTFAERISLGGEVLTAEQLVTNPQPDVFVARLSW